MPFDDRLSRKSLELDPNWPPKWVIEPDPGKEAEIEAELQKLAFNFEEWLDYKLKVPNDGRKRIHKHPKVEYLLTEEEFQFLVENEEDALCNPYLCPEKWDKYTMKFGEVTQRFQWLALQEVFLMDGYPYLPRIIWESKKYLKIITEELLFKPFVAFWKDVPDDFWIKLSYILEGENYDEILYGLVLVFHSQGRIFPSPDWYKINEDPEPDSLYLADQFWM